MAKLNLVCVVAGAPSKCPFISVDRMWWMDGEPGCTPGLEIEIGDPVHQVEETECGGEEDARIRVYLGDADVQPAVPPGSGAAVFEAAEEAGAVLPIQALVAVLLVSLLHVRGVVHLDGRGRARADVHRGRLLVTGEREAVSGRSPFSESRFLLIVSQTSVICTFYLPMTLLTSRHHR